MVTVSIVMINLLAVGAANLPVVVSPNQEVESLPWQGGYRAQANDSIPKTLLFWTIAPDELEQNASNYAHIGFNGILVGGIQSNWSSDIWARDGKDYTIGVEDELLQTWKRVNRTCAQAGLDSNFIKVAYYQNLPDWFNDAGWEIYTERLRQTAVFARLAGFRGVAIDTEYIGEQYDFNWPEYSYRGYSRKDLVAKVRERMRQSAAALFEAYPEMELLTFPGGDNEIIVDILTGWIEEAASRQAPGGVHLLTEWTYLRSNPQAILLHVQELHRLIQRLVSSHAWRYWQKRCSVGPAGWPVGKEVPTQCPELQGAQLTPDEFRSQFAGLLLAGKRYIWIYPHRTDYLPQKNAALAEDPQAERYPIAYVPNLSEYHQVLQDRLICDDDALMAVAKEIRNASLKDFGSVLGLRLFTMLRSPRVQFESLVFKSDDPRCETYESLSRSIESLQKQRWTGASDPDLSVLFGTQTTWRLIGPFDNSEGDGFDTVYGPEREIDLNRSCSGVGGDVSWEVWECNDPSGSMDLKSHYERNQWVCAYALGYLTVDRETPVQIRVGVNDAMKMWVGGELVFVKPPDSGAIMDNWIVDLVLAPGITPVLLKVCNEEVDWGFYFRVTTPDGKPAKTVRFSY